MNIIKPPQLKKGHKLGLVAPASHVENHERIQMSINYLESLGFQVQQAPHLYDSHGYFAGKDQDRADDLNRMFRDSSVNGIFCLTGGWGSSRVLPFLDYESIRKNPKVIMGYSDITALLNGIYTKTGLVTFHGPVANKKFSPYSLAEFQKIILNGGSNVLLGNPLPDRSGEGVEEHSLQVSCLYPGKICGSLVGGNLTLISHLVGTQYLSNFSNKVLFLEDVNEKVYRIDRMLTQLKLSGKLDGIAGIVFGQFTGCLPDDGKEIQFSLDEVLVNFSQEIHVPTISGLMIGHIEDQTTLPLGCLVELDSEQKTLKLLEAGVVL